MRYSATSSTICPMVTVSLYTLSLLFNIVSNKELVRKSRGPTLKSDNSYNEKKKITESIEAHLPMKKQ